MYVLASHIVSTYSGMPFRKFVQERIFDPLGMNATTYSPVVAGKSGLLSQQWSSEAAGGRRISYWVSTEVREEFIAGAGGIISTAVDMVRSTATRGSM